MTRVSSILIAIVLIVMLPSVASSASVTIQVVGNGHVEVYEGSALTLLGNATSSYSIQTQYTTNTLHKFTHVADSGYRLNRTSCNTISNICSIPINSFYYSSSTPDYYIYEFVQDYNINSNPPGAAVYYDDVFIGNTPLNYNYDTFHSHQVVFNLSGYYDYTYQLNSPVSMISITMIATTQPTPTPSLVNVISTPSGANVYLPNNAYIGTTPFTYQMSYNTFTNIRFNLSGYSDQTIAMFYNSNQVHAAMVSTQSTPTPTPTPSPTPSQTPTATPTPVITPPPDRLYVGNNFIYNDIIIQLVSINSIHIPYIVTLSVDGISYSANPGSVIYA